MTTLFLPPDDERKDVDSPLRRVARTQQERIAALQHWLDHGYFDDGAAFVRSSDGWMMWKQDSLQPFAESEKSVQRTPARRSRSASGAAATRGKSKKKASSKPKTKASSRRSRKA